MSTQQNSKIFINIINFINNKIDHKKSINQQLLSKTYKVVFSISLFLNKKFKINKQFNFKNIQYVTVKKIDFVYN